MALSEGFRETIPVMDLQEEISRLKLCPYVSKAVVRCKAFEDNEGALELALIPKLRPRTY